MSQNIECFDAADSTAAPLQPRRTSDRAGGRTTHRAGGAPHGNTRGAASVARLEEDKGEEDAESSGSDARGSRKLSRVLPVLLLFLS